VYGEHWAEEKESATAMRYLWDGILGGSIWMVGDFVG
jgi:hypothetical protein